MPTLFLLALTQGPSVWTVSPAAVAVGDTVYLSRTLPAAPGIRTRPQPLSSTSVVEPLADPAVELRGEVLVVRYAVALFEPGRQRLAMPSIELFYADGNTETVLGDTAVVRVGSVLPAGDSLPPPRPSLAPLPRSRRNLMPAALLVSLVAVVAGAWAVSRKRVGPRPPGRAAPGPTASAPLHVWVEAGEVRAAAAALADVLRRTIAGLEPGADAGLSREAVMAMLRLRCPGWPLADLEEVLRALERARFAPAVPHDVLALEEQVHLLAERLRRAERTVSKAGPFEVTLREGD